MEQIRPRGRHPGTLKRTLTRVGYDDVEAPQTGRAYLDSGAGGCGWDSIAGVHKARVQGRRPVRDLVRLTNSELKEPRRPSKDAGWPLLT